MKPQFTQRWQHAEGLARHAWRCYLNRPDVTVDAMSLPSYQAWIACNATWDSLSQIEKEIVKGFHAGRTAAEHEETSAEQYLEQLAQKNRVTVDYIWQTVRKAWRLWAIHRGLADE